MGTASARRKRNIPLIIKSQSSFSQSIHQRDSQSAAKIVFTTTINVLGKEGLMKALDRGNSFFQRKKRREGL